MVAPLIVAEIAASHNGSLSRALEIVDAAYECGADAVKIQTFTPGTMSVDTRPIKSGPWAGKTLPQLYAEAQTPWDWHGDIFERCKKHGMIGFSTPFSTHSVDFLEEFGVEYYKIASFEITDLDLIRYVASKGKPVILSTGMATEDEIQEAVSSAENGKKNFLLKCVSAYPASIDCCNLATMSDMRKYGCGVGLSDHTMGRLAAVVAASLGAEIIEKHLTLRRSDGGPDADFSAEPHEFAAMVRDCRGAARALGEVSYGPTEDERDSLQFRRGLWAVKDIKKGETITRENVKALRPATGLLPSQLEVIENKRVIRDVSHGTMISTDMLDSQ